MQWEGRPPPADQTTSGPKVTNMYLQAQKLMSLKMQVDADLGALNQATTASAQASAKYVMP